MQDLEGGCGSDFDGGGFWLEGAWSLDASCGVVCLVAGMGNWERRLQSVVIEWSTWLGTLILHSLMDSSLKQIYHKLSSALLVMS